MIRPYADGDEDAVLSLLQASLGWVPDDEYRAFFVWKHHENPFGRSPAWVAVDGERIVGFRTFLRWEFDTCDGPARAVRAVDTATHPDAQGRGVFRALTMNALDELAADGVDFVFNTPNDASRPGYLKMGWRLVDRLPAAVRPRSPMALLRIIRSRVPAAKWSEPTDAGESASDVVADGDGLDALLAAQPSSGAVRTRRSAAYLRWRYGYRPLRYRAALGRRGVDDGVAFFRLRRRGAIVEAALCDVLAPEADPRRAGELISSVVGASGADAVLRLGPPDLRRGFLPVPRQGPTLVWRAVNRPTPPPAEQWHLALGDIELF